MSAPRRVLPGTTYLITRTTRNQRFFLAPDDSAITVAFWFCLAVAASISGVQVTAVAVLSNHVHLVVTDPRGELPRFTHWLFRHFALCIKVLRGIDENVWSAAKPNCTELVTPEAILEAIAYTLANPASSGLVPHARSWPGVLSTPADLHGRTVEAEVPPLYFSDTWEPQSLRFTLPPALAALHSTDAVVDWVKARIAELERESAARLRSQRRSFLGLDRLRKTAWTGRPAAPRAAPPATRRVPTLKAVCAEALAQAVLELRAFREAYREALERWRAKLQAVFPPGTWWMCRFAGAPVAPAT